MRLITRQGGSYPLWFEDADDHDISIADFDPITTEADHDVGKYIKCGFGVKNATETAGFIRAVTLSQYEDNHKSLTGITPRTIRLNGGDWCLTPIVKVCAANHATTPSTGMTYITVGLII
jgi:hypothetical protein